MRPQNLKTRIFLDSGDPNETREIISILGFLDGQTTNPTLISKHPEAAKRLEAGEKFTKEEIMEFYKQVVRKLARLMPEGSISIEVYADKTTTAKQMLEQGRDMFSWISNAHIKYPTTPYGLAAAEASVKEEMRVNMTLCFRQEQAAAVYGATRGAKKGQVFVSPFIGRLDDRGENGMDLIENILRMYKQGDGHVEVLTASVRNLDHLLYALKLGSDIVTAPFKVLKEWADKKAALPDEHYTYNSQDLKPIPYVEVNLEQGWQEFEIEHELTEKGMQSFSDDWNKLVKQ